MLSDRDSLLWWMLRIWHERSHTADGAAVSCDMATVNGWHRWPFFPSCSASNIRLCCSRHLPRQMCVCGGGEVKGGGGGVRKGEVADTCLSQDEPAFVTWEPWLAAGTGPRQIWQGRWQGPGCTLGATLQSNTNKTPALFAGPAVRGSWEASVSVHWKQCWNLSAGNQCCMDEPLKHKRWTSNAALAVLVAKDPCFSETSNSTKECSPLCWICSLCQPRLARLCIWAPFQSRRLLIVIGFVLRQSKQRDADKNSPGADETSHKQLQNSTSSRSQGTVAGGKAAAAQVALLSDHS